MSKDSFEEGLSWFGPGLDADRNIDGRCWQNFWFCGTVLVLFGDRGPYAKFALCFRSTVELLVDSGVGAVQGDIAPGRI